MNSGTLAILRDVGKNVENTGRMLQRRPPFDLDEIDDLIKTLSDSAVTLEILKKIVIHQHS